MSFGLPNASLAAIRMSGVNNVLGTVGAVPLYLGTNSTVAVTIDASQVATFGAGLLISSSKVSPPAADVRKPASPRLSSPKSACNDRIVEMRGPDKAHRRSARS